MALCWTRGEDWTPGRNQVSRICNFAERVCLKAAADEKTVGLDVHRLVDEQLAEEHQQSCRWLFQSVHVGRAFENFDHTPQQYEAAARCDLVVLEAASTEHVNDALSVYQPYAQQMLFGNTP